MRYEIEENLPGELDASSSSPVLLIPPLPLFLGLVGYIWLDSLKYDLPC